VARWIEIFDPVLGQWARFPDSLLDSLPPSPPPDHGTLPGLGDDDHTQYHNDTRGDLRYAPLGAGVTTGDSHDHAGGDGAQIAYGGLSGLPTLGSIADNAESDFAVAARGVTNGDSHDHAGGDGAQVDHGGLGGLADDDHTQYVKHSLATAVSDFLVASGAGAFVKKTLAEVKTLLGLGTAAAESYVENTWTPSWTSLTIVGALSTSGSYIQIGKVIHFWIQVSAATSTAATNGATYCDLPAAASVPSVCIAANGGSTAGIGLGLIAGSAVYVPTWGATGSTVVISGTYRVA